MPPYEFRVKPLPPPIAVFGGKSTGSIPRATAAAQQGVFAIMPDFDFDLQYTRLQDLQFFILIKVMIMKKQVQAVILLQNRKI